MKNTVIARRYAGALCSIAIERNILESISKEMMSFDENLRANPGFRTFLYSQDISKKEKKTKLESTLQDRVSNVFFNFLLILLKKNRESIFPDIMREFQWLVDQHNKKTNASAITAVPLDRKSTSRLKEALDKAFGLDVQIENMVDESIIGGIIVRVHGQLLDGSLKNQLSRLRSQLMENKNLN